ncbi:MAG: hypothetical protein ACRDFX_11405, partial [Chloroflexota bacterium]
MASTTVTLALEGDEVSADAFGKAVRAFSQLVEELSKELAANDQVRWAVADLKTGSAIVTFAAIADDEQVLQSITDGYETVGKALRDRKPPPYTRAVDEPASVLSHLIRTNVTSLRFETAREDIVITDPLKALAPAPRHSLGAIRGRIETVTQRRHLRFTLYDSLNDRAVACYIREDQQEPLRTLWGQRAVVEGVVSRDPETGRPLAIRDIQAIVPLADVEPGTFTKARGVWASGPG